MKTKIENVMDSSMSDWVATWCRKHLPLLEQYKGLAIGLHPLHGVAVVGLDILEVIDHLYLIKDEYRANIQSFDVNELLRRFGHMPIKRKSPTPRRRNPPKPLDEKNVAWKLTRKPGDPYPIAVFDPVKQPEVQPEPTPCCMVCYSSQGPCDARGHCECHGVYAEMTLAAYAKKHGYKTTEVLMHLLAEGYKGIHINSVLSPEMLKSLVEKAIPKPNPFPSPHKQPAYQPRHGKGFDTGDRFD